MLDALISLTNVAANNAIRYILSIEIGGRVVLSVISFYTSFVTLLLVPVSFLFFPLFSLLSIFFSSPLVYLRTLCIIIAILYCTYGRQCNGFEVT